MNIELFQQRKQQNKKISMLTCYDYWSAKIIEHTPIDCILVGDSTAMIMHGFNSTIPATVEMMVAHTHAVANGAKNKFIVADLPFCSYRKNLSDTVTAAQRLMQAGAHAIKLEGAHGNQTTIQHLTHSGIPVMGHLGLTPQSINTLGGFKVQGKNEQQATNIMREAHELENAGCFAIVLECVPAALAQSITQSLTIPSIGIGAGPHTDGQVLVLHDLLGLMPEFNSKFIKRYANGHELMHQAINQYHQEVTEGIYPNIEEHCY